MIKNSKKLQTINYENKILNGCTIEINNLNDAIQITRRYKRYEHENKGFQELDKKTQSILDGFI